MLVKELNDCEKCPLLHEFCNGGLISNGKRIPIPFCLEWDENEDLNNIYNYMKLDNKIKEQ